MRLAPDDVQLLEVVERLGVGGISSVTARRAAEALEVEPVSCRQRLRRLNKRGLLRLAGYAGSRWEEQGWCLSVRGREVLEETRRGLSLFDSSPGASDPSAPAAADG